MNIEKNKVSWISRTKLIELLNDSELLNNILSIKIINSDKLSNFNNLSTYNQINDFTIIVILKDFSFFIGLPFPFSKKDFKNLEDIENTLKKNLTLGLLFFELGSWVTGIIEYKKVLFSKRGSRYVKGKHKAGGQSQRRFERNREKWIESLQNKVYQDIKNYLLPEKNKLNYFICLGDTHSLNNLINSTNLKNLFGEKIIFKKSNLKNYTSKTIVKAASNLWSSRIYLDDKNAIVEKI